MTGLPLLPLLLLLCGRATFMVCRSLNAAQDAGVQDQNGQMDGTDSLTVSTVTGVDRQRRHLLEKTHPFVLVDGQRRSLAEALQRKEAGAFSPGTLRSNHRTGEAGGGRGEDKLFLCS